ncbi:hypothetical protein RQP46_000858 [Phenoliferia psychrophenolica]
MHREPTADCFPHSRVCAKCEKKFAKSSSLACTDVWRPTGKGGEGARNERKVGENKLLSSKARYSPYAPVAGSSKGGGGALGKAAAAASAGSTFGKCQKCLSTVSRAGAKYCQGCAYKAGVCAMCAKQVLDVSQYKMSAK